MSEKDIIELHKENLLLRQQIAEIKERIQANNKRIPYLTDFYEKHKESIFDRMLELGMDLAPLFQGGYNNRPLFIVPEQELTKVFKFIRKHGVGKVTFGRPFENVFKLDVLKDENIDELEKLCDEVYLRLAIHACGDGIPTLLDFTGLDSDPFSNPEWKHEITDTPPIFRGDFATIMGDNPPTISEEAQKMITESIERDGIDISIRKEI